MELAFVNFDIYLLGLDGKIGHFYPEGYLGAVLPCNVGLDALVKQFFESPEDLLNPISLGWAENPNPPDEEKAFELDLHEKLDALVEGLPTRATVALASRAFERYIQHLSQCIPLERQNEFRELNQRVVLAARDFAMVGRIISQSRRRLLRDEIGQFLMGCLLFKQTPKEGESLEILREHYCDRRCSCASLLAHACTSLQSPELSSGQQKSLAVSSLKRSLTGLSDGFLSRAQLLRYWAEIQRDTRILIALDTGAGDCEGDAIPDKFFMLPINRT